MKETKSLHQLLLKILETSQISVDVKAISAAWRKHSFVSTRFLWSSLQILRCFLKFNKHSFLGSFCPPYLNLVIFTYTYSIAKGQEAPTARAISERLVKIRALAKENGSKANFSVSSGKNPSAPTTPRKRVAKTAVPKKAGGGIAKKGTAKKRKRGEKEDSRYENC